MLTNLISLGSIHPVLTVLGVNIRLESLIGFAISILFLVIVSILLLSCPTFDRSSEVAQLHRFKLPGTALGAVLPLASLFRNGDLRSVAGEARKGIPVSF